MALAGDTPIPTPEGWVLLQDIEPGQMVFDERGEPCSVIAVCRRGPEPVSRVEFDDKAVLIAGEHHHWVSIRSSAAASGEERQKFCRGVGHRPHARHHRRHPQVPGDPGKYSGQGNALHPAGAAAAMS